jgi:hypothetical protein
VRSFLKIIPAWLAILCPIVALGAEADPFVKITSPKSGIVVRPGERLTITVDATPHAFVAVMAPGFGAGCSSAPPCEFEIVLPSGMDSGPITLALFGVPPSGFKDAKSAKDAVQDEIELDVERIDGPASIKAELLDLRINAPSGFRSLGEIRVLTVTGVFADGTEAELRRSRLTVYMCNPESVVKVSGEGTVTAIGHGRAKITIRNGNATAVVPVSVP